MFLLIKNAGKKNPLPTFLYQQSSYALEEKTDKYQGDRSKIPLQSTTIQDEAASQAYAKGRGAVVKHGTWQ